MSPDSGNASLELTLGVAILVTPLVMLIAALPLWLEAHTVATLAAREAARVFVLADDSTDGRRAAEAVAERIAEDHGVADADFSVRVSGRLVRGTTATAHVVVRVPVIRLPLLADLGRLTLTGEHREVVDTYRSR